jgi:uncharacterized membrane protein (UPF0136 family)
MTGSEKHGTPRGLQWGEAKPGGLFGLLYDTWLDTYVWLSLFFGGLIFGFGLYALLAGAQESAWLAVVGGALLLLGVVLFIVRARKPPGWGAQP